ncbi:MAG: type II toxin-antitoxin system RelE/ParE family toxin [Proteobacteria bacterium]|nr:type II toxin-antitoxin system RelE/ParE family toxin [Pseudomonadota bacterium]
MFGRYVLVYRVIKETRVLQVLAVRHHRQRSIKLDESP